MRISKQNNLKNISANRITMSKWVNSGIKKGAFIFSELLDKQSDNVYSMIINGEEVLAYAPGYNLKKGKYLFLVKSVNPQLVIKPFPLNQLNVNGKMIPQLIQYLNKFDVKISPFSINLAKYYATSNMKLTENNILILRDLIKDAGFPLSFDAINFDLVDKLSYFVFFLDENGLLSPKKSNKKVDYNSLWYNLIGKNGKLKDILQNNKIFDRFLNLKSLIYFLGLTFENELRSIMEKNEKLDLTITLKLYNNSDMNKLIITDQIITKAMQYFYTDFLYFSFPIFINEQYRKAHFKYCFDDKNALILLNLFFDLDTDKKIKVLLSFREKFLKGTILANEKNFVSLVKNKINELQKRIEILGLSSFWLVEYESNVRFSPFDSMEEPYKIKEIV